MFELWSTHLHSNKIVRPPLCFTQTLTGRVIPACVPPPFFPGALDLYSSMPYLPAAPPPSPPHHHMSCPSLSLFILDLHWLLPLSALSAHSASLIWHWVVLAKNAATFLCGWMQWGGGGGWGLSRQGFLVEKAAGCLSKCSKTDPGNPHQSWLTLCSVCPKYSKPKELILSLVFCSQPSLDPCVSIMVLHYSFHVCTCHSCHTWKF